MENASLPNLPPGVPLFDTEGALSREYLLARGFCCGNGCRNCPYSKDEEPETKDEARSERRTDER